MRKVQKYTLMAITLLKGFLFSALVYAETEIVNITAFDTEKQSQDWQYIIEAETGYIGGRTFVNSTFK